MNDHSTVRFKINNSELWGGLIGLALGVFVIWSGLKLRRAIGRPGSGYVLFYTGADVRVCRDDYCRGGHRRRPDLRFTLEGTRWTKPLLITCLTAFSFALDQVGFLLSAIPLLLLLLRVIDPVRWTLASLAVLTPLGVWWVLKHLLLIQLPSGIFEIG
jgi:putative tricarboxylic transport membrane protein